MKRVIYMSRAWIAALLVGMVLAGCGGGGSGGSESATQSGSLPNTGSSVGSAQPVAERSAVLSWSAPMTRVNGAGWSSLVARRAHNPKVVGSNPAPATT